MKLNEIKEDTKFEVIDLVYDIGNIVNCIKRDEKGGYLTGTIKIAKILISDNYNKIQYGGFFIPTKNNGDKGFAYIDEKNMFKSKQDMFNHLKESVIMFE